MEVLAVRNVLFHATLLDLKPLFIIENPAIYKWMTLTVFYFKLLDNLENSDLPSGNLDDINFGLLSAVLVSAFETSCTSAIFDEGWRIESCHRSSMNVTYMFQLIGWEKQSFMYQSGWSIAIEFAWVPPR